MVKPASARAGPSSLVCAIGAAVSGAQVQRGGGVKTTLVSATRACVDLSAMHFSASESHFGGGGGSGASSVGAGFGFAVATFGAAGAGRGFGGDPQPAARQ